MSVVNVMWVSVFFFKQKTAYEMRISDWSSDVCSSDLERGVEVDVKTGLKPDELKAIIGEYDGLAIRSATKVTAEIVAAADRLKVVGRAGIGVDNVDIPAATGRGIVVMNTPDGNSITTDRKSTRLNSSH